MNNTIGEALKDSRYNMAITFIVQCMGIIEVYTDKNKLILNWGKEEGKVHFLNTKELIVNIY
jgi:hypothetical protein